MRSYGQYCPIARGSEVFAERWTPIIVRNILQGCRTFNEIASGSPGLSRALLTKRLHDLQRVGVIEIRPKENGHGSLYEPTRAGEDLLPVLTALGVWADNWMELTPEHSDPGVVLWSWIRHYLRSDLLPDRRLVVRFDFVEHGQRRSSWLLIEQCEAEICPFDPGFGIDVVVDINDNLAFSRWHLGLVPWPRVLKSGAVRVSGPRDLRRALPTWNSGPEASAARRVSTRGAVALSDQQRGEAVAAAVQTARASSVNAAAIRVASAASTPSS